MTAFDIAQHRAVVAKGPAVAQAEILWWSDVMGRFLQLANMIDIHFSATPPGDTTKIWYRPHTSNAANGSFQYHNGSAWVALTPGALFTHLRIKAGYNPGGGPGGLSDGDYGDVLVGSGGTTLLLDVTGVMPGTYGDGSHVPQVIVDAKGRITGVNLIPIGDTGVSGASLPAAGPITITLGTHADLADSVWKLSANIRCNSIVTSPSSLWYGVVELSLDGGTTWTYLSSPSAIGDIPTIMSLSTTAAGNRTPFLSEFMFGRAVSGANDKFMMNNRLLSPQTFTERNGDPANNIDIAISQMLAHAWNTSGPVYSTKQVGQSSNYSAGQTVKARLSIADGSGNFNPAGVLIDKFKAVKTFQG